MGKGRRPSIKESACDFYETDGHTSQIRQMRKSLCTEAISSSEGVSRQCRGCHGNAPRDSPEYTWHLIEHTVSRKLYVPYQSDTCHELSHANANLLSTWIVKFSSRASINFAEGRYQGGQKWQHWTPNFPIPRRETRQKGDQDGIEATNLWISHERMAMAMCLL